MARLSQPYWAGIQGTLVSELRSSERPGHDIFRYGGVYYTHDNEYWYTTPRSAVSPASRSYTGRAPDNGTRPAPRRRDIACAPRP